MAKQSNVLIQRKDTGSDNDFILADTATGFWVEVDDVLLHVYKPYGWDGAVGVEAFKNVENGADGPILDSMTVEA